MLEFLLKLWKLNRPYKGRFILGVLFGMLNGVAQPLMYGTAFFVVTVIFTPHATKETAWTFSANEIKDWSKIVNKVRRQADPVSVFLWGRLSTQEQGLLTNYQPSAPGSEPAQEVVVQALNKMIGELSLYQLEPFKGLRLRRQTADLLGQNPTGPDLAHLNRLLLEDAYPRELPRIPTHVPAWLPQWAQDMAVHFKEVTLVHFKSWLGALTKGSLAWRIAVVSLIPLVVLFRGVVGYLNSYLMAWVAVRTMCDCRAKLFEHLLNLPLSFFSRVSTGELMSRSGDIGIVQNMIAIALVTLIQAPMTILTCLVGMFAVDWKLTLITMVVFPVCVIPIGIYNRKGRLASAGIQNEAAALGKAMHEAFTGNRIIKAYNLEEVVVSQFKATLRKFTTHFMRVVRATESPGPVIEFLGAIGITAMILYLAGTTGEEGFGFFIIGLLMIYAPVKALIRLQSTISQAEAATQRVFELLATPNTVTDPSHPVPLHATGAEIHFDNVSFSYGEKTVLHNIQLKVSPGQIIAIVGRTGAGKTTLTNLLLRFYDPTEGALRIGGTDLRQFTLHDLRSQVGVVTQEVILFNDTIRSNIACGRPGASFAEIETAAKHAHAHEFIMDKPKGYETVIGEQGVMLSGGQRQRISIARAILKNAPILVLDEATSSLDSESERMVQAALDELMKGRTTFCIAHRLSTVQNANLILVLDQGRIVETGRHEELLARRGLYYKLHNLQFRKAPAEHIPHKTVAKLG
jgi:subfamily B ATP-binding cassette protein MsbA